VATTMPRQILIFNNYFLIDFNFFNFNLFILFLILTVVPSNGNKLETALWSLQISSNAYLFVLTLNFSHENNLF